MKTIMADEMHEIATQAALTKEGKNKEQREREFQDLLSRIRGLAAIGKFNLKSYLDSQSKSKWYDTVERYKLQLQIEGFKVEKKEKRYGFLGMNKTIWYNISW